MVSHAVIWAIRDELEPEGLGTVEFGVLRALQFSGTSSATQLGRLLPVDQSRISRAVNELVNRGLLSRRRQRRDRRVVLLEMTAAGEELIRALSKRVEQRYDELFEGVSAEDMERFLATADTIMANRRAGQAGRSTEG
jgi:DNA-binding MarR family transcriptional regulator